MNLNDDPRIRALFKISKLTSPFCWPDGSSDAKPLELMRGLFDLADARHELGELPPDVSADPIISCLLEIASAAQRLIEIVGSLESCSLCAVRRCGSRQSPMNRSPAGDTMTVLTELRALFQRLDKELITWLGTL